MPPFDTKGKSMTPDPKLFDDLVKLTANTQRVPAPSGVPDMARAEADERRMVEQEAASRRLLDAVEHFASVAIGYQPVVMLIDPNNPGRSKVWTKLTVRDTAKAVLSILPPDEVNALVPAAARVERIHNTIRKAMPFIPETTGAVARRMLSELLREC